MYSDNAAWVHAVTSNLEGSASGWLVSLRDEGTPELTDLDAFMQALREQLEDPKAASHKEVHIHILKQDKWLVLEYFQDCHNLASHLRDWPEHMLVYQFQENLNKELYHNCLPRGVPSNLWAWY